MLSNGESFLQYGKKAKIINGVSFMFLADIFACPEIDHTTNVQQFTGEFATVTLNRSGRQTNLSRDVFGAKSLFYYYKNYLLIASTEIRYILQVLETQPAYNESKISEYLDLESDNDIIGEDTFFEDIKRVLPGETCIIFPDGVKKQYFYKPADYPIEHYPNPINFFGNAFENAVKNRLSPQQSTGANLSGGLDSSSVVSVFRHLSSHKLDTFYFNTNLDSANEKKIAEVVADEKLTNHHSVRASKNQLENTKELIKITASPDTLSIPSNIFIPIYRKANELGNSVVLSGHGGDNILENGLDYLEELETRDEVETALYSYFSHLNISEKETEERITRYYLNKNGKSLRNVLPAVLRGEMNFFIVLEMFFQKLKASNKSPKLALKPSRNSSNTLKKLYPEVRHKKVARLLSNNLSTLSIQAMEAINAISKANEIETSYPFLSKEILETVAKIPSELNFHKGKTRGILKQAMQGTVPDVVLNRTDKSNFTDFYVNFVMKLIPRVSNVLRAEHIVWNYANSQAYRNAENAIFDKEIPAHKKLREAKTCYRVISLGLWLDAFAS